MGLIDHEDREALLILGPPQPCFLCGQPTTLPVIEWTGETTIWLHLRCALHLSRGLLQDVEKVMDLADLRKEWGGLRNRLGAGSWPSDAREVTGCE